MDKTKLVQCVIGFYFVILSFIGLNANIYSWRTKKFYVNYFLLVWCITFNILFTIIYIRRLYIDIISDELDLDNAVTLFNYMNIIGAFINYLSQLVYCKASMNFFNVAQLFPTLEYFDLDMKAIHSSILLVTMKTIVFPTIIEITLILKQLRDDENKSLLWTIYTLYPLVIVNIIPNCLFGVFVICRIFTLALNNNLSSLEKEANFLQNKEQITLHNHFYRMQKFCDLADKLDELSEKYALICSQTLAYINLCTAPLLGSLLCNLFGVTTGFFLQYYALADTIINEESYDVFNAITNGVFLIISFLEIALHSLVANQNIQAVRIIKMH